MATSAVTVDELNINSIVHLLPFYASADGSFDLVEKLLSIHLSNISFPEERTTFPTGLMASLSLLA